MEAAPGGWRLPEERRRGSKRPRGWHHKARVVGARPYKALTPCWTAGSGWARSRKNRAPAHALPGNRICHLPQRAPTIVSFSTPTSSHGRERGSQLVHWQSPHYPATSPHEPRNARALRGMCARADSGTPSLARLTSKSCYAMTVPLSNVKHQKKLMSSVDVIRLCNYSLTTYAEHCSGFHCLYPTSGPSAPPGR